MSRKVEVHPGRYHDSVRLMQVSRLVGDLPRVRAVLVAMGTELNLGLAAEMGFDVATADRPGPDDLVVAVDAEDDATLDGALRAVEAELATTPRGPSGLFQAPPCHVIESAAAMVGATVGLISVPGPHAFVEAMAALRRGLHVMVFSDGVPLHEEIRLKKEGTERGLLVMGPDCGTAIVDGVGLGFANVVRPGPVAIAGASGTGIQQLCCLLDDADVGVRHALGTGSRDLSAEVGAASTLAAMAMLDADPGVEVVVVVSKPPHPEAAALVRAAAATLATPVLTAFVGEAGVTLEGAAADVIRFLGREVPPPVSWPADAGASSRGGILGLFSGGTLCAEAEALMARGGAAHRLLDLGADEYTRGRAHPMIDQRVRLARLAAAAEDEAVAVVLLDVVLGHGAHPDPASELAPVVATVVAAGKAVVVSLCGTRDDLQGRERQAETLRRAGASVWLSNAAAARHAVDLATGAGS